MSQFDSKRVTDPIHGTIGLSDLELKIISSPAFQRLRKIKQLGLGYLVYPGAGYSRLEHSIGVCHVTGKILENLNNHGANLDNKTIQQYRLAGLLHDIGHYPFSHAMEFGLEEHASKKLFGSNQQVSPELDIETYLDHERAGKEILEHDPDISKILADSGYDPVDIHSIFLREQPPPFSNLISSDLDADRIDYLLRSSHHAGLPYGNVDLGYLLSQIRIDSDNKICITAKALRTADHLLLCRYFDYQQISFHKTVAGLEEVLKDVISLLIDQNLIKSSASEIMQLIKSENWQYFHDEYVIEKIKKLYNSTSNEITKLKASSILYRKPPKLIVDYEKLSGINEADKKNFGAHRQLLREHIDKVAEKFDIPKKCWYLWHKSGTKLTKIGGNLPISALSSDSSDLDNLEQAIYVLGRKASKSTPIISLPNSLMYILSNYALYSLRLYALIPDDKIEKVKEISDFIKKDIPDLNWS